MRPCDSPALSDSRWSYSTLHNVGGNAARRQCALPRLPAHLPPRRPGRAGRPGAAAPAPLPGQLRAASSRAACRRAGTSWTARYDARRTGRWVSAVFGLSSERGSQRPCACTGLPTALPSARASRPTASCSLAASSASPHRHHHRRRAASVGSMRCGRTAEAERQPRSGCSLRVRYPA